MSIVLLPFEPQSTLAGPGPAAAPGHEVEVAAITGGQRVALLDRVRGVVSMWKGREAEVTTGLEIRIQEELLPGGRLRVGPGSWEREIPLPSGGKVLERGLLPDVGEGIVLQWQWIPLDPSGTDRQRLSMHIAVPGGPNSNRTLNLSLDAAHPGAALILPGREAMDGTVRLLRPLEARERQRANRRRSLDQPGFRVIVDGTPDPKTAAALEALDDAPLRAAGEAPHPLIVGGIERGVPNFLAGSQLAEFGVAALMAGRRSSARGALEALCAEADPPALSLVHLAGRWAHWTGDPRVLLAFRPVLDRAASALDRTDPAAALPDPSSALKELMDGIEPLGDEEWNQTLREVRGRLEGGTRTPRRRSLPVFGAPLPEEEDQEDQPWEPAGTAGTNPRPEFPSPDAFASPDHPGLLARRTVQGARILRSWIEGVLGARPDAGYGRMRIAPEIQDRWRSFEVEGVTSGDAVFSFRYRREESGCQFTLTQVGGRVPVNLIFEPRLPMDMDMVGGVWIDGESAEVEVRPEEGAEGRVRLRCQLPLDGEREIRVAGTTSGSASSPS